VQDEFTVFCDPPSKQRQINRFKVARPIGCCCRVDIGAASSKQITYESNRLPTGALNENGFPPMPRYFFNTRIGDELISDPEGEELRNPDRAWEIARAMIRELLKTEDAERGLLNAVLEVTDDEGEIVLEFPFAEAILDGSGQPVTKH
jgi:hypothetical protein